MEKYDFTSQHLYGENHRYITKILELLQASNLETEFLHKFYTTTPMLNFDENDCRLYANLARNAFEFIKEHNSKYKLRLYRSKAVKDEEDHTVIEILSEEMPFLFDSAICLLNRLNIEVDRSAHPNIFLTRDQHGKLISIDNAKQENNKQELIIQIRTTHLLNQTLLDQVELELRNIINLVQYAVSDWKKIIALLQDYTANKFTNLEQKNYLEQKEFLQNMENKYFVFLGSISYNIQDKPKIIHEEALGILRENLDDLDNLIQSTIFIPDFTEDNKELLHIGKLNKASVIHRDANYDYLCVKELDEQRKPKKVIVFIGLFTSILYYQSATLIPIIRDKLHYVLQQAGFGAQSYAGKELVSIIESLPRDELFQISAKELFPLVMEVYALLFKPELRIFLRKKGDILSCLLFLPLEIANTNNLRKIRSALAFEYGPIAAYHFMQINNSKLCYYHFIINSNSTATNITKITQVEQELKSITKPWESGLYDLLLQEFGKNKGREIFTEFEHAFPASYKDKAIYSKAILEDIENISTSLAENKIIFKVIPQVEDSINIALFKIYYSQELNLSSIMPMLQNMGLNVAAEQIYVITPCSKGDIFLHQFILKVTEQEQEMLKDAKKNIEEAFYAMWDSKCQNDSYNNLVLKANLTQRQVTILRALAEYLCQIKIGYSSEYIGQILNKHSETVKLIIELFYSLFDYKITADERNQRSKEVRAKLEKSLSLIHDNVEDQIIRRYIDLINNILRTNYFLTDNNGHYKDFISLKINSEKILNIPLPRPYREIFVYSTNFEGIHLRGGKVARGGIRWSDRSEDYRTEILGLMKTQVVKNSVIVPTGAKGGFILKNISGLGREELQERAIECYQNFLRGLLDITDNIIGGKVHNPKHIVRYDENDPYLVVAADKGTASFSDIANGISAEYSFWLGDAFASGGSKGYDHKKMAITARGAWVSVTRHFYEMGININETDFTVVGIGDMSGDVFGNGMLLSENIKLIAAFNHIHIFIDPNPDCKKSFIERQRLFNLPRSTWQDYDPKILSAGARIYSRKEKTLELTPEIKSRFKLSSDSITPNELIKVLLTAEVDLLWNGGIGTYVKASFETHEQVGDKTNDLLRCNGSELRCKIVGEGGNLGFTQFGRIEYARNGGKLNTDAIDNSAGVDCSDHEVNIKIALHQALQQNMINEEERIKLLEAMTEEVAELVLKDNRTQTRALTIAQQEGFDILDYQEHFIDILEEQLILDRKIECLPSKQQFIQLHTLKQGLTRPELSVLLAYSKNAIYNNLIETKLPEEEYFYKDLLSYFPEKMRNRFNDILALHPLRREIIATTITNSMVNRIDTFYLHLTSEATGHKFSDIASAYTITRDVFGLRDLWKEINSLDGKVAVKEQVHLYVVIKKFVMRSTSWLLRNYRGKLCISSAIEEYQEKVNQLQQNIDNYITGKFKANYEARLHNFIDAKVPHDLARKIAILGPLSSAYNIAEVSNRYKIPVEKVATIYFDLGHRFNIDWLRDSANSLKPENNWQKLAINGFKDELYDIHRRITAYAVEYTEKTESNLEKWYKQNEKHIKLFDRFITEVKTQDTIEYAMIDLTLKKLGVLLTK